MNSQSADVCVEIPSIAREGVESRGSDFNKPLTRQGVFMNANDEEMLANIDKLPVHRSAIAIVKCDLNMIESKCQNCQTCLSTYETEGNMKTFTDCKSSVESRTR